MPRKKKVVTETTTELPPESPAAALVEQEFGVVQDESQLDSDISRIVEELGDQVTRCYLYRIPKAGKQAYLGTIDADEFSLDEVAARYGGGKYLARFRDDKGFVKGGAMTFVIADEVKRAEPPGPPPPLDGTLPRLLERLLDQLARQSNAAPAGRDPMEIAASLGQIAASQSQATIAAMTPLLAKITELAAGGGGKGSPASELFEAIELGMTLGGKDEGYLPVIREVGKPLVETLNALMLQRRGLPVPVPPSGTATGGGGTPPSAVTPLPPGTPAWVPMLQPHVAKVLAFAVQGADPALVASALELQFPRLARWLEQQVAADPTFEDKLATHYPEIAPHRPWVTALLGEFAPEPFEENDEPADSE